MRILTLLLFTVFSLSFSAQETDGFKKNSIYGNLSLGWTLNYERTVLSPNIDVLNHLNLHIGGGRNLSFGNGSIDVAHISIVGVTGSKSHHLMYGIGLGARDYKNDDWYNVYVSNYNYDIKNGYDPGEMPNRYSQFVAFKLGYRYMKPGGRFMFNAGIGLPELVFVGAGFTF